MRTICFTALILSILITSGFAEINRPFEPVVLKGEIIENISSYNYKIDQLYLFAYHASSDEWELIPYQFDEVNPDVADSIKYFIKEENSAEIFDSDDELVFMVGDLGDKAPLNRWVELTKDNRFELAFTDPVDNEQGYAYLFYGPDLNLALQNSYQIEYFSETDQVISKSYKIGFNETGFLSDVYFNNNGIDLFDRMKIRIIGSFWILPVYFDEEAISFRKAYSKVGLIRIIRNMVGELSISGLYKSTFTQTSYFYPYSSAFELNNIPINEVKDKGAEIDEIRVSWDFNENARNMTFYSEYNANSIIIDGSKKSNVDLKCNPNDLNWTYATGANGTLLNIFYVPGLADRVQLYFHEATDGSSGDKSVLSKDSGDMTSYADNGFSLIDNIENYLTDNAIFSIQYYNYFLPDKITVEQASSITAHLKYPLSLTSSMQYMSSGVQFASAKGNIPEQISLEQNFPNPFNSSTIIPFSLNEKQHIVLKIYDASGREIVTLAENLFNKGNYNICWDGSDKYGAPLASGIYFYKLMGNKQIKSKKLLLIK